VRTPRQRLQNVAVFWSDVAIVHEPILENHEESLYAITPRDLLSLSVGPTTIGDGNLVQPETPFGDLGGDFRLDAEPLAADRNGFDRRGPKDLEPGFCRGEEAGARDRDASTPAVFSTFRLLSRDQQ
jgi:hypothetical protein